MLFTICRHWVHLFERNVYRCEANSMVDRDNPYHGRHCPHSSGRIYYVPFETITTMDQMGDICSAMPRTS